jgi:hypothetical protein
MATLKLTPGTLIQSTFDKVGFGQQYDTIEFTEGNYTVNKPLKLNSGTRLTGSVKSVLKLENYVTETVFPPMTPIFGQKGTTIEDIIIENICFDGNANNQSVKHGKGFHNFIGISKTSPTNNPYGVEIRKITVKNSMGDGARLTNCKEVSFHDNTVIGCGHDGFYADKCTGVIACNNTITVRVNSGLRCRGSSNVLFSNNTIKQDPRVKPAYSPGIQIENSEQGVYCSGVTVSNNNISNTLGPGIWVIGTNNIATNAASNLLIEGNTIIGCGIMPAYEEISGVGGIVIDGWDEVLIKKNMIVDCLGYGILIGDYLSTSKGTGYTVKLAGNNITGTKPSLYPGESSGEDVVNLIPSKYTVKQCDEPLVSS